MKKVTDPRSPRKKAHGIAETLTWLIMAYIAGRTSLRRAVNWANSHRKWLRRRMNIKSGIASVSTVQRMLAKIDEEEFSEIFIQWMTEMLKQTGIHIIIDGKALRGATERRKDGNTPYILNAIDAATNLVIAQLPIPQKENEIVAIPTLLELLNLNKNTITIDAIGTQRRIMEQIVNSGGHYLLTVKLNNKSVYEEIIGFFRLIDSKMKREPGDDPKAVEQISYLMKNFDEYSTVESNRERIEHRSMKVFKNASIQSMDSEAFDTVKCIGLNKQIRIPFERDENGLDITRDAKTFISLGSVHKPRVVEGDSFGDDVETVGMISDIVMDAEEMSRFKREHWKIENNLHHVLDDAFREDRSPARKTRNNLALIRKFAYNILQIAILRSDKKIGITAMMDRFADDMSMQNKYVLKGIESFY